VRPDVGFRAVKMAGRGVMCLCACGRWLPAWLPEHP
jgi:hypothetical protein